MLEGADKGPDKKTITPESFSWVFTEDHFPGNLFQAVFHFGKQFHIAAGKLLGSNRTGNTKAQNTGKKEFTDQLHVINFKRAALFTKLSASG